MGSTRWVRVGLARPSLEIGNHKVPLDVPSIIAGLILAFFNIQIAQYVQVNPTNVMLVGSVFLLFGLVFFIYGRIGLRINA
jgi:hypothetical protein